MAIWVVRVGKRGEHEERFLQSERIYLTWPGLRRPLGTVRSRSELIALLRGVSPDDSPHRVGNHATQILSFVQKMEKGDWVIVPSKRTRSFHVAEIVGGYTYDERAEEPYFHYRRVRWVARDVPRELFDSDLRNSLGGIKTVFRVWRNDAEERIRALGDRGWGELASAGEEDGADESEPGLRFYVTGRSGVPPIDALFPCVTLASDAWNDLGYRTLFHLRVFLGKGEEPLVAGPVKILRRGAKSAELRSEFSSVGRMRCSLGQNVDYYAAIDTLRPDMVHRILTGLNDVAYSPDLVARFEDDPAFGISLTRYGEAQQALRTATDQYRMRRGEEVGAKPKWRATELLHFRFKTQLPGASQPHELDLDFAPDGSGLHRVTAVIGRNGTGKTRLLAALALAVSGEDKRSGEFEPAPPGFGQAIAVSFSAFDQFRRPTARERVFSYVYCGIRAPEPSRKRGARSVSRLLRPEEIRKKIERAIAALHRTDRERQWRDMLHSVLGDTVDVDQLADGLVESVVARRRAQSVMRGLSSGQLILTLVLSELVVALTPGSVVLFDEPEMHLHPEALVRLTNSLHRLLAEYDSYAVLATHSPLVLQEVPARRVRVLERTGTAPRVARLAGETFGEGLSALTQEVFGAGDRRFSYYDHLVRLARENGTFDDAVRFFPNGLGVNATAQLLALTRDQGGWGGGATRRVPQQ